MGVQNKIVTRTFVADDITGKTGALALGVPGNIFDASPARIHTETLEDKADFGTFVEGKGVLVNSREAALVGTDGDPLAPSLTLAKGDAASFMTFGHVVVRGDKATEILTGMDGRIIVGANWTQKGVAISGTACVVVPETAEAFSEDKDYKVGEFVKYEGKIYVFKAVHAAGEWDDDDVVDTSADATAEWTGSGTAWSLYKYWGDTCVVVEVNGFKAS